MLIEENFSLKDHNTFRLDVRANLKVGITQPEELKELYDNPRYKTIKKLILGGGSNVLFTRNFLGLVLKMEIGGIAVEQDGADSVIVSFGAGENWHQCVLWAVEQGYAGIENLSLIPGTVGAAPMQNIGAYGVELKEVFHSLDAYDVKTGKISRFYNEDCKFGYRYSVFKGPRKDKYIITRVYLRLSKKPKFNITYGNLKETLEQMGVEELTLKNVSQAVINIRQSKLPDPLEIGNAGSFFKNPVIEKVYFDSLKAAFEDIPGYEVDEGSVKLPAAWLIDQCGWKGTRIGDIGVHDKQALVLVNHGNGKGKDILKLSMEIQKSVFSTFGVELEREVNVV
ncbi:MAG: UDP-N-acetylmuramate dehydrogenase [Marinoscillum sp.]|uniref:UDP-N-acetylmuramate dehydrogenase n=1 Tax=Marinoscillum sp. TaxID=2024838 RepID=UPI0032F26581